MKKFKLNLSLIALVLGLSLAVAGSAFRAPEVVKTESTDWFLLNESTGQLIQPYQTVDPDNICPVAGSKYCAREYNVVNDVPTSATSTPVRMKQ